MRFFIQALLILSILLSAASPACKFISGKENLLEICAADGSLQKIIAPDDYKSPLPAKEKHEHQAGDPCAFCFAASHSKPVIPGNTFIIAANKNSSAERHFQLTSILMERAELAGIEARPPPIIA